MATKWAALTGASLALMAGEWQAGLLKRQLFPFAAEWPWSSLVSLANYFDMYVMPQQVRLLEHVLEHSRANDPADVVAKIDQFCWSWPTMNVGDVKGPIVDKALESMGGQVKVAVELGSYIGYSTLRLSSVLRRTSPEAVLYSVDPNALGHAMKVSLLHHAGLLGPRVSNELRYSGDVIRQLAMEGTKIDFLFLDHLKHLYKEDTELALSLGVLREGSLVVADNVLNPGAPEYRAWILANDQFETEVHATRMEYSTETPDEVVVSRYRR